MVLGDHRGERRYGNRHWRHSNHSRQQEFEELQSLLTDDVAMMLLSRLSGGLNLYDYPLDGPLPELPPTNAAQGRQRVIVDLVVPVRQRRGIYRTEYAGTTLRENLCVPVPSSRYAVHR